MIIAIGNIIGRSGNFISDGNTPVNTIAPIISGTPLYGNILTSTTGTWTSDTGITAYLYQWTANGLDILGATASTYLITSDNIAKELICKVAAIDLDGTSSYVNSNALTEQTVNNFQSRVISDGGVFEAKECLINSIDNI